ncbi:hypothetical protein B6S59_25655 [Pseudomonas sp. A46]|jgi:hypothetical protein|uniref:DUF3509 domain-containing protein n=1 Tax=Metapseudomonas furukawaii TaxID=1149133 RepID=UPI000B4A415E|nr:MULTISPECIES: DUF3509 domain-containing protein [Pseudomonas]OWJ91158.1 hypothetical protein B6S59_25655 [Pseudomonas sp. A46]WAG81449.1 DUF3509 domain-containing protein [Pseudomonas furukawaii]
MKLPFTAFFEAFPQHRVTVAPRPDGSLLLSLEGPDGLCFSKAIDREALYSEARVSQAIREVQRDLKLDAGEVHWRDPGVDWVSRELPTYGGGPLQETAAKTLVARRKAELKRRARASA